MNRRTLFIPVAMLLLCACSPAPSPTPTATATPTAAPTETPTPAPTGTLTPTATIPPPEGFTSIGEARKQGWRYEDGQWIQRLDIGDTAEFANGLELSPVEAMYLPPGPYVYTVPLYKPDGTPYYPDFKVNIKGLKPGWKMFVITFKTNKLSMDSVVHDDSFGLKVTLDDGTELRKRNQYVDSIGPLKTDIGYLKMAGSDSTCPEGAEFQMMAYSIRETQEVTSMELFIDGQQMTVYRVQPQETTTPLPTSISLEP